LDLVRVIALVLPALLELIIPLLEHKIHHKHASIIDMIDIRNMIEHLFLMFVKNKQQIFMQNNNFLYIALSFSFGCILNAWAQNANRVHFTIDPEDREIVLPVHLNDSITANMCFDTGMATFTLDSSFCASHHLTFNAAPDSSLGGTAWAKEVPILFYKTINKAVRIGNADMIYKNMIVYNYKDNLGSVVNGAFGIPQEDTAHVWELNFEHNYLEIHPATDFQMPKDCFLLSMIEYGIKTTVSNVQMQKRDTLSNTTITTTRTTTTGNGNLIVVKIPMQIKCTDGDTLTMNDTCWVDTGMPWDFALLRPTKEESDFFSAKKNVIMWQDRGGYRSRYTVSAILFNHFAIDSLFIYTFSNSLRGDFTYLIGLNFLKRFNVFFDMKNHQVGLRPIKIFQRILNPLQARFHYSTTKTQEGKYIVTKIADFPENYFKTAGLQEGDEIIAVNGLPYSNNSFNLPLDILTDELRRRTIMLEDVHIFRGNTLTFDIIRQGKPMKIVIVVNKNEDRGD